jgi:hypothetical protein
MELGEFFFLVKNHGKKFFFCTKNHGKFLN